MECFETDKNGYINMVSLSSFIGEEIEIEINCSFYSSDTEARTVLGKGFDYVLQSRIPPEIVCGVLEKGKAKYKINVLKDGSLQRIEEIPGFPNEKRVIHLIHSSDNCEMNLDYFTKHSGAVFLDLINVKK